MKLSALVALGFFAVCSAAAAQTSSTTTPTQTPGASGQTTTTQNPQQTTPGQQPSTGEQTGSSTPQPVPYSPEEFPAWLRSMRRAEIITVGAFPITLLLSSLGYQAVRYAENGFAQAYVPAILGTGSTPLTNQEKTGVLISGGVLAALVAFIDFALGQREKAK